MKSNIPLKRHLAIQPLSREHHEGLLLCWKIRNGFSRSIEPDRMKNYTDWYYSHYLKPHFELEEQHIFPILGKENELIRKALAEHRKLKRLFEGKKDKVKVLSLIEEELENHIRFEERVLFAEIQKVATEKEFALIASVHPTEIVPDNWVDCFWEN